MMQMRLMQLDALVDIARSGELRPETERFPVMHAERAPHRRVERVGQHDVVADFGVDVEGNV